MDLAAKIEGILFYSAAPMEIAALAKFFAVGEEEVQNALQSLQNRLGAGGTRLLVTDTEAELVTAPELSETIESLRKDDLRRDIGKAGAETLAIVAYRGPLSRAEIDRVRGVNSTFILRNLLIRGLVERRENPKDARTFLYAITPDLLAHLGIGKREDLPQFTEIMNELDSFEKAERATETQEKNIAETHG